MLRFSETFVKPTMSIIKSVVVYGRDEFFSVRFNASTVLTHSCSRLKSRKTALYDFSKFVLKLCTEQKVCYMHRLYSFIVTTCKIICC